MRTLPKLQVAPSASNVVSFAEYQAADLDRRRELIAQWAPSRAPGPYPGTDYYQFARDLRALGLELRNGGICKLATAAGLVEMMSVAADLACRNVRTFEDRALMAEKLLRKNGIPVPVLRKSRGPYKDRKPKH